MKEQIKTPEKGLSDEEKASSSDADFKTLVIRMLTELIKLCCKMKSMQSEIKQNIQGTNSEGKEIGTQINDLERKEEMNIQLERNEETRIQKMSKGLGNSGTTWNVLTSES